jgi:prolyl oligopeptidase
MKNLIYFMTFLLLPSLSDAQGTDPYLWLEDVNSEKALDWVNKQNTASYDILAKQENYQAVYDKALEIYNSADRIAAPAFQGNYIYNFWQDAQNERGIWRRTSVESYLMGSPKWETLLDLDEMSKKDGVKWVYKGAAGLYPDYNLFMISLSKGGGDAVVTREYDVRTKSFVKGGFELPEAKGGASWVDENTLLVSSDFGEGTMTTSGYPRQVKLWKRGTDIKDAKLWHQGNTTDVGTWGGVNLQGDKKYIGISQALTFYTTIYYAVENDALIILDLPEDVKFSGILNDQVIVQLRSDWKVGKASYPQGALLSLDYQQLIKGKHQVIEILRPDEKSSIDELSFTKNFLLVNMTNNVKNELYTFRFEKNKWIKSKVNAPELGSINFGGADDLTDRYFFYYQNFLTPSTLYIADAQKNTVDKLKSLPAYFDASKYQVQQFEARSKDGTMIPYFVVASKTLPLNGKNPTLLYGYGGFEISNLPFYSGVTGYAWLDKGGVYVLSNIRGGGEFGPKWHQAALKGNRQKAYDDFHAIAESLIEKKITSGEHLGIMGGSNGGLLVGVAFTQRPDLYKAVVCAVPLLDMQRFNKLLAGASWMGEYGDPDKPEEWEFIKKYSPYHNLKAGTKYPEVFFTTSTRDDRVHPGHARKMVAKMEEMGYKVYYYENTEGGHAGSSTNDQRAKSAALQYAYLWMKLK